MLDLPHAEEFRVGDLVAHLDEVLHREVRDGVGVGLARFGEPGEVARPVPREHSGEQRDVLEAGIHALAKEGNDGVRGVADQQRAAA